MKIFTRVHPLAADCLPSALWPDATGRSGYHRTPGAGRSDTLTVSKCVATEVCRIADHLLSPLLPHCLIEIHARAVQLARARTLTSPSAAHVPSCTQPIKGYKAGFEQQYSQDGRKKTKPISRRACSESHSRWLGPICLDNAVTPNFVGSPINAHLTKLRFVDISRFRFARAERAAPAFALVGGVSLPAGAGTAAASHNGSAASTM